MYSQISPPRPLCKRPAGPGIDHTAPYTILTRASSSRSGTSQPSASSHTPHSRKHRRSNQVVFKESKSTQLEHVAQEKGPQKAPVNRISLGSPATPSPWGSDSSSSMKLRQ